MSQKQLNRFVVISKVIAGHLTNAEPAINLGISERQFIRLKKGVIAEGAASLIHKNTNRKPAHALEKNECLHGYWEVTRQMLLRQEFPSVFMRIAMQSFFPKMLVNSLSKINWPANLLTIPSLDVLCPNSV